MSPSNELRTPAGAAPVGDEEAKQNRLAAQWPKKCGTCAKVYMPPGAYFTGEPWHGLEFAYRQTDAFADMEARHCACGSTLLIYTKIHDLKEE